MAIQFSNNAKTTLSSGVVAADNSLDVVDASVFPTLGGGDYFLATLEDTAGYVEIVRVTAVSGNTLSVTRAQESTTARDFAIGSKFEGRLTAGGLQAIAQEADTNTTYQAGSGLVLVGTTFSLDPTTTSYLPVAGGTMTGDLTIEDASLHIGDKSNSNWSQIRHLTTPGYGFNWEYDNALAMINEQGSSNQALILGDAGTANSDTGLFGISRSANSGSSWTKKLDLRGDGDLYIGSSAQNRVWHAGDFSATDVTNWNTAYGWGSFSAGGTITGDVTYQDNVKASFGTGNDLQLYHANNNSFIDDAGNGALFIRGSQVVIDKYHGETMINAVADGRVDLYYDNAIKLTTTADGIAVDGSLTTDLVASATYPDLSFLRLNSAETAYTGVTLASGGGLGILLDSNNNDTAKLYVRHGTADIDTATPLLELDQSGNMSIEGALTTADGSASDWQTAYSWGDHSTAGYLVSGYLASNLSISRSEPELTLTDTSTTSGSATLWLRESANYGLKQKYNSSGSDLYTLSLISNGTETTRFGVDSDGNLKASGTTFLDASLNLKNINSLNGNTILTSASTVNAATLDGSAVTEFYRQTGTGTNSVQWGWITVAGSYSSHNHGEVIVTDNSSGSHSFIRIDWMRSHSDSTVTVLNCGGHGKKIIGVRVLQKSSDQTNGKKYLQIYATAAATYDVRVNTLASPGNYSGLVAVTPLVQTTITGYSLQGTELYGLGTHAFAANSGIRANGDIYSDTGMSVGTNAVWHAGDFAATDITNWQTAYGWGDHSTAGYFTSWETDLISSSAYPANSFLRLNSAETAYTGVTLASGGGVGILLDSNNNDTAKLYVRHGTADIDTATPLLELDQSGNMSIEGVLTTADGSASNWQTAYGWGDHSTAGYFTSWETDLISSSAYPTNSFLRLNSTETAYTGVTLASGGGLGILLDSNNNDTAKLYVRHGTADIDTATPLLELDQTGDLSIEGAFSAASEIAINDTDDTPALVFKESGSTSGSISTASSELIFSTGTTERFKAVSTGLSVTGTVTATGDITAFSDARLKTDVQPIAQALDTVSKLEGVTYSRVDNQAKNIGFVAQQIEQACPELAERVVGTMDDDQQTRHVNYASMVALLVEAVKELKEEIDELKAARSEAS